MTGPTHDGEHLDDGHRLAEPRPRPRNKLRVAIGLVACLLALMLTLGIRRAIDRQAAARAYDRAREALQRGDLLEALRWANESLEKRPGDREAEALRGSIFETRAKLAAAVSRPPAPPQKPVSDASLVRELLRAGKAEAARERLAQPLAKGPDRELSWLLSRVLLQLGDREGALAALKASAGFGIEDPTAPEPAPYVGSGRCVDCHAKIAATQRVSRHARTLPTGQGLDSVAFPPGPVPDPGNPAVTHRMHRDAAGLHMETAVDRQRLSATIRYVLGSGNRGQSFIGRSEFGQDLLLRMTYYDHGSIADLTPMIPLKLQLAHDHLGVALPAARLKDCLDCHATDVSLSGSPESVSVAEPGIGCEKCHGPGGNHLRAMSLKFPDPAIGRPREAPASLVVAICAKCHQPPGNAIPDASDPTLVRQQALTMPRSRCYSESRGGMTCVTCHSPHRNAETSAAHYERKCLHCHPSGGANAPSPPIATASASPAGSSTSCPVNPSRDCLGCHMPRVENKAEHSWFTDHHIRIQKDHSASTPRPRTDEPPPPGGPAGG